MTSIRSGGFTSAVTDARQLVERSARLVGSGNPSVPRREQLQQADQLSRDLHRTLASIGTVAEREAGTVASNLVARARLDVLHARLQFSDAIHMSNFDNHHGIRRANSHADRAVVHLQQAISRIDEVATNPGGRT